MVALALERQSGGASTPYAETLFLIRWLLEHRRKHGAATKLRWHLEYLWNSCSGNIAKQSDLFRLTYATETLKQLGWDNAVMNSPEWCDSVLPEAGVVNRLLY
nr:DUF2913 family protein [Candidatus Erwinia dacicola]